MTWNPDQYARYSNERSRPFFDLLSQVHLEHPSRIVDLGCGSGELTATLLERWPEAQITGVDNSPEMIERARRHEVPDRLRFELTDLSTWQPPEPLDLIFSNAVFHWLPDHAYLLQQLMAMLNPMGVLAFQVPGNFEAPSHRILGELVRSNRWRSKLEEPWRTLAGSHHAQWYLELLMGWGMETTGWETTYLHLLNGENPVLEWVKGTALRPVLAALDEPELQIFLDAYGSLLRTAYPPGPRGTVFPFRRVFVVTRRPGNSITSTAYQVREAS